MVDKDDNKIKELLEVDLDSIVDKSKETSKTKTKRIVLSILMITVLCIIAIVAGITIHNNQMEKDYALAIEAQENGDYGKAAELFIELGDYKDSVERAENNRFAVEFLYQNENFQDFKNAFFMVMGKDKFYVNTDLQYDVDTRIVILTLEVTEDKANVDITAEFLAKWDILNKTFDDFTKDAYSAFDKEVSCILMMRTGKSDLYITKNGISEYNYIDMKTEKDKVLEPIYNEIVLLVQEKKYEEAIKCWDNIESLNSKFYTLDYKDISHYYYYAVNVNNFISSDYYSADELQRIYTNLKARPIDFLETKKYIEQIEPVITKLDIIKGKYSSTDGSLKRTIEIGERLVEETLKGYYIFMPNYTNSWTLYCHKQNNVWEFYFGSFNDRKNTKITPVIENEECPKIILNSKSNDTRNGTYKRI